jgi:hypothetical protein
MQRIGWKSWVMLEDVETGQIHSGMLYNLNSEGLYFECDVPFESGSELKVMINKMPDAKSPGVFQAEVRWAEEIIAPVVMHHYGVGACYTHMVSRSDSRQWLKVIQGGVETA